MFHQKTTQNAIAAMSRLAELYGDGVSPTLASSRDIAESRSLPAPLVAKILTELSRGGLVTGSPGPGGGYKLAKSPREITLYHVVQLFERDAKSACPYGPGWCGNHEPCPLHHSMLALQQIQQDFLKNTNFGVFVGK
ncbi:MAG: Rrf2 family transcriptional regulator [Planctomycetales bacterium]|nr:Rrf2 family transcriptional regulator [Planctomycetales bacterium]